MVVRHGGEEFFVLITGADPQLAATIGERYRAAIEGLVLSGSAGVGGVTVSIGVAVWTAAEEGAPTPERMLAVADAGLYEAKRNGRNRVVTTEAVSDASVLGRIVHPSIIPSPKSRGGVP